MGSAVVDNDVTTFAFRNLKHLRFPVKLSLDDLIEWDVDFEPWILTGPMVMILEAPAPSLVRLSLIALDLFPQHEDGDTMYQDMFRRFLELLLFPVTFKALRYFELDGWLLPRTHKLEEFFRGIHRPSRRLA